MFTPPRIGLRSYQGALIQARAYRAITNFMAASLGADNISLPEWAILGLLMDNTALRPSDLAAALGVKPPVVTVQLRDLEKRKLVVRTQAEGDSRASVIKLTDAGRQQVEITEKRVWSDLRGYLKDIGPLDVLAYIKVLRQLARKL
ncbi:MAG TPA: MarR family transcriptional regulator [Candidatus Saccharimonadia bacterium]|jgi:DNA-binding MarR family transcriptional regulator|nr:MarR family transcriptional regulator [Candidatus Saccharimonadia bacterium]